MKSLGTKMNTRYILKWTVNWERSTLLEINSSKFPEFKARIKLESKEEKLTKMKTFVQIDKCILIIIILEI